MSKPWLVAIVTVLMSSIAVGQDATEIPKEIKAKLKPYECKYHILYTDLPEEIVREAILRLSTAAEEYANRTKGFSGAIRAKAPVYMFSSGDDYKTVVGAKYSNSGGLCRTVGQSVTLYVRAEKVYGAGIWQVMRHEGFHQFVRLVIGGQIPVWVNEGLAVYFEYSIWTGDNLVCDMIPPNNLKEVKELISSGKLKPFSQMVDMTYEQWNTDLKHENYVQAWSMVYFLAHAENGRYQQVFSAFISDVAGGAKPTDAFNNRIGRDFDAFQKKYCEYWKSMPENPSLDLYRQATVQILTGFLARAWILKKTFKTVEEFFAAAADGKLAIDSSNKTLWLPPSLLEQTIKAVKDAGRNAGQWSLEGGDARSPPSLVLKAPDGAVITGQFKADAAGSPKVWAAVKKGDTPATQNTTDASNPKKDSPNQQVPGIKPQGRAN